MPGCRVGVGAHPGYQEVDRGTQHLGDPLTCMLTGLSELSLPRDALSVSFSKANRL